MQSASSTDCFVHPYVIFVCLLSIYEKKLIEKVRVHLKNNNINPWGGGHVESRSQDRRDVKWKQNIQVSPLNLNAFHFKSICTKCRKKIFNGGMAKFLKKSFNTSIYVGYLFLLYCWVLRRVNMILIKQIGTRNVPVNFSGMLIECLFYCFSGQIVPPRRRNKSSAASSFSSIQTTG